MEPAITPPSAAPERGAPAPVPPLATGPVRRSTAWLRRLYLTLRTEHTTPVKLGIAVGLGVFIGCSPFWGLHFAMCLLAGTVFRVNRMLVYAAANVANPVTAPFLVFAEIQVGHRLLRGQWLGLSFSEMWAAGIDELFLDFLMGGLLVGLVLGIVFGVATTLISRAGRMPQEYQQIVDDVVRRYLAVSIRDAEAARRRLLRDPVYAYLLRERALESPRILDLGCGRGLVAAVAAAACGAPRGEGGRYVGVDSSQRYVRVAREALGDLPGHTFVAADLRDHDPPPADLVLLVNTLRFLPIAAQDALLRRLGKALPPGARLLVREVDAASGLRARLAQARDTLAILLPGRTHHPPAYRRAADLRNALVAAGFEVRDRSTVHGTPGARVLLEATRKPAALPR